MQVRHQHFCQNCRKQTLHELDPDPINQVYHLLLSLFACGCWLPVWIILNLTKPDRKVRCVVCGQATDEPTRQQEFAVEEQRERAARLQYALEWERKQDEAAGKRKLGSDVSAARPNRAWESIVAMARIPLDTARAGIGQVDTSLRRLAGDDVFALWIFRGLTLSCMLLIGSVVLFVGLRAFQWI